MSLELASTVLEGISALTSILGLLKNGWNYQGSDGEAYEDGRFVSQHRVLKPIAVDEKARAAVSKESAFNLDKIIDGDVLEAILQNINRAKAALTTALALETGVEKAVDSAEQTICTQLSLIKRLNGRKLPDLPGLDLYALWESYRCGR